ncbi:MAG: sugar phosphate isomerase/epimerase [Verrucomicrobiales bacterium]|nr:sugar phosphate isomerase/epimerase [Verrucomicrobiales bacterium]
MTLCGISDEAGNRLAVQIQATKELGWTHLELRNVEVPGFPNGNVHDIPPEAFDALCATLESQGMQVAGFGSTIGNWASQITDPFEASLERVDRAIPRMQRLGTKIIRVMSYAIRKDEAGKDAADQMPAERFRRLRALKQRFDDAGITMVHENCMNYGGMSISHALETLDQVPGLRWVFDTGNPVFNEDRNRPGHRQDAWEFYQAVKPHISHVHIKDGVWNAAKNDCDYLLPGQGDGQVGRVLDDLIRSGYQGFVSIEPHVSVVFHSTGAAADLDPEAKAAEQFQSYVDYGRALEALLQRIRSGQAAPAAL